MITSGARTGRRAAWRASQKVLQSRRVYQSSGRRFFDSPGVTAPYPDTSEASGNLLAPEPAVRTSALIGCARVSTSGQLLDRQQHALAEAGCLRVFADNLSGKNADRAELAACLDYLRRRHPGSAEPGPAAARARGARLGRPPAMTAEQIRHARDLLTRPDNTVSSIARLLGVSRATIYKYVPKLPA